MDSLRQNKQNKKNNNKKMEETKQEEIKQVVVSKTSVSDTNKDGVAFKYNSVKVGISVVGDDGQDYWLNGFCKKDEVTWVDGDTITLIIYNDEKWGMQFKIPQKADLLEVRVERLEQGLKTLYERFDSIGGSNVTSTPETPNMPSQQPQGAPDDPRTVSERVDDADWSNKKEEPVVISETIENLPF